MSIDNAVPAAAEPSAKRGWPRQEANRFGRTMRVAHEATRSGAGEIITPRELIEDAFFEPGSSPRLATRRTLYLLLEAAAGDAWQDMTHKVTKGQIGQDHKSRQDVEALLLAVDQMRLALPSSSSRGRAAREYVGLFERLCIEDSDGADAWIEFRFRPELRSLFAASTQYAILNRQSLWQLECRYALTLYVLGCLFFGRRTPTMTATPKDLVELLGMPAGTTWAELERRALLPAKAELGVWAHFTFDWTTDPASPRGRQRVRRVTLSFDAKDLAIMELDGRLFAQCDRRARRKIKNFVVAAIAAAEKARDQQLRDAIAVDLKAAADTELSAGLANLDDEIRW